MYFRIEYSNGYNCNDELYIKTSNLFEAEKYAEDCLDDYACDYIHICIGYANDYNTYEEYEEAYDEYMAGCTYDIFEITKEEYEENNI